MIAARLLCLALAVAPAAASAQPMLYAQRLPEGTVYVRLANGLAGAASIETGFAGQVSLGGDGGSRISPYFVAGESGGKPATLQVTTDGQTRPARFTPPTGSFVTVVLHPAEDGIQAAVITDKPEYNQLKARLSFYNATPDCGGGALNEASGRPVFSAVAANAGQSRSINPVAATVTAACASGKAPPLDLGRLEAGGQYSVWLMRLPGGLTAFLAHDTIAPPRGE